MKNYSDALFLLLVLVAFMLILLYPRENEKTLMNVRQLLEQRQAGNGEQTEQQQEALFLYKTTEGMINYVKQTILQDAIEIIAIGDSLTEGVGDETGQGGYVGILQNKIKANPLPSRIENLGERGNRTNHLLQRLHSPIIQEKLINADIIFITIGANDIMHVLKQHITNINHQPFAEEKPRYQKRLQRIFQTIRTLNKDADIYLIGFYNPFAGYFPDIHELKQISEEWNAIGQHMTEHFPKTYFIPTADLFHNQTEALLADDHFHPNQQGYQYITERILQYIQQ